MPIQSALATAALDPVIDDIPMQEASVDIWDTKYRLKTKQGDPVDQDIDATFRRVARALAAIETTGDLVH